MLSWLFGDILYYLALLSLAVGIGLYLVSHLVKFLPMLKPQAFVMQIGGIVLAILGGYYVADHHGYQRRVTEDQAEIDRLNAEARAKESELKQKLAGVSGALRKAKDEVKSKQDNLTARVDSNELRFPTSCSIQASANAGAAAGDSTNASNVERQALKDIIALVAEGDAAITQLNACIDTYQKVREMVNVKP
jgi:hypothetical protein